MKRLGSRVVGLLDLPEGVLHLILSFLGTLSLAAARLTCRALRGASTSGRKRVYIHEGDNMATVCASPVVLQWMHTFQILLDRLDEEKLAGGPRVALEGGRSRFEPDNSPFQQFRRFLQRQLFENVAREIVSFERGERWCMLEQNTGELAPNLQVLLAQMQRLERLVLNGPFNSELLAELPALGRLTCLEVDSVYSIDDIQTICSTLSLSRFAVFWVERGDKALVVQHMLSALATGSMAGLRELVLPLPTAEARHLSRLAPLTALTALELRMEGTFADLGGLGILTGLKSLDMEIRPGSEESQPVVQSLSPLSALTGLTFLGVYTACLHPTLDCSLPSDVSVLSSLTALQVLRCSCFGPAEVFPGDALPVQFRFLRSATALEELELDFLGSFCSLPHACSLAMQEAVCALTGLKTVSIAVEGSGSEQCYLPLSVFAGARSIESFKLGTVGPNPVSLSGYSSAQALACFKGLTGLQTLVLDVDQGLGNIHHCADLLAGLPSTCLTWLDLKVKRQPLSLELMQQIARFPNLECLQLLASEVDPRFLAQVPDLKCLKRLWVCLEPVSEHAVDVSAICAQTAQLRTVILERARQVGLEAAVTFLVCLPGQDATFI